MFMTTPDDPAITRGSVSVSVSVPTDKNVSIEPLWTNVLPPDEPFGVDPEWVAARFDNPMSMRAPVGVEALKKIHTWPGDWKWSKIDNVLKITHDMTTGKGSVDDVIKLKEKVNLAIEFNNELVAAINGLQQFLK